VIDRIRATPDASVAKLLTGDVLREWLQSILGQAVEEDQMASMLGYEIPEDLDETDALCMHIRAASTATLMRALLIYLVNEDAPIPSSYHYGPVNEPTIVKAMAQALDLDTTPIEKEAAAEVKEEVAARLKALKAQLKAATLAPTLPPSNPSSETSSGGAGEEKSKPAKTATRKLKTSPTMTASEAMSGIAAAMQIVDDQATTASPDAQATGLAVGTRVTITTSEHMIGGTLAKWAGKSGTVTSAMEDGYWDVSFRGRNGGIATFHADQLTVVEAEVAA
jgi:hypothetical protein